MPGDRVGLVLMYIAGVMSGLLGIGSGALRYGHGSCNAAPHQGFDRYGDFMIGVTAAAGAGIYFMRGDIVPFIAAPVAVGVSAGAMLGSRLLGRIRSDRLRAAFVVILLAVSLEMLLKGLLK